METSFRIWLMCSPGLEPILAQEIQNLSIIFRHTLKMHVEKNTGGVELRGTSNLTNYNVILYHLKNYKIN